MTRFRRHSVGIMSKFARGGQTLLCVRNRLEARGLSIQRMGARHSGRENGAVALKENQLQTGNDVIVPVNGPSRRTTPELRRGIRDPALGAAQSGERGKAC